MARLRVARWNSRLRTFASEETHVVERHEMRLTKCEWMLRSVMCEGIGLSATVEG